MYVLDDSVCLNSRNNRFECLLSYGMCGACNIDTLFVLINKMPHNDKEYYSIQNRADSQDAGKSDLLCLLGPYVVVYTHVNFISSSSAFLLRN